MSTEVLNTKHVDSCGVVRENTPRGVCCDGGARGLEMGMRWAASLNPPPPPPSSSSSSSSVSVPGTTGSYPFIVAASVGTYWLFVSLIPVYNKYFFQKSLYPYPIATAGIQLGIVSFLLVLLNSAQHYLHISRRNNCNNNIGGKDEVFLSFRRKVVGLDCYADIAPSVSARSLSKRLHERQQPQPSWVLGPHLWWKVRWVAPIGCLFGFKYGVTNLGLHLISAPTHLLLQSTDLVWTLLSAWMINGETVTPVGLLCLLGCVGGSVVLTLRIGEESISAPFLAIAVNLLSPMLLGLCITTLRSACTELMRKDNRVGGTVSAVELTALKLILSSAMAIFLACIFEREKMVEVVDVDNQFGLLERDEQDLLRPSWWVAFHQLPYFTKLGVMGGSLPILAFQVNCTFLTFLTSAVVVGVVGQVKIIPQWAAAAVFATKKFDWNLRPVNLLGALLTMTSAGLFALENWRSYRRCAAAVALSMENEESLTDDDCDALDDDCDELEPCEPSSSHDIRQNNASSMGSGHRTEEYSKQTLEARPLLGDVESGNPPSLVYDATK